jgi:hypothetical protein
MSTKCITCPPNNFPSGLVCAGNTTSVISERDALTGFAGNTESSGRIDLPCCFDNFIRPHATTCANTAFHSYTTVANMPDQKKTRRQVLEEFVQKSPNDAFSRYGLAMECAGNGDTSAAITHYAQLIEQHSDYVPAYLMYGQLLAKESRLDDAKRVLTAGISAADNKGDQHAASEMQALLADLQET